MARSEQSWWSWATGWATGGASDGKAAEFKPPTGKRLIVLSTVVPDV